MTYRYQDGDKVHYKAKKVNGTVISRFDSGGPRYLIETARCVVWSVPEASLEPIKSEAPGVPKVASKSKDKG